MIAGRKLEHIHEALDLGVGVWARGPVRRRPHGRLRAIGRGRHPGGTTHLPNTFASVDHPFHVARAEILWRELTSGNVLRWIAQHQGGYPVEFYPLGEAWLEVAVRALSLGTLPAEGAHTLAIIALFLAPGAAFAALAHQDGWSPAVGLTAFVLHISLPGGWYDGGYTELVQWGLVTNVAGAVAAFCMLPAIVWFLHTGAGWAGAAAGALGALAIYCNPRSLLALAALGLGAWLAGILRNDGESIPGGQRLLEIRAPRRRGAGDAGVAPTAAHRRFVAGPCDYCDGHSLNAAHAGGRSWPRCSPRPS